MDTDYGFSTDLEEHETSSSDSELQSDGEDDTASIGRESFDNVITAATEDSRYVYVLIDDSITSCPLVSPERSTCLFDFLQFEPR